MPRQYSDGGRDAPRPSGSGAFGSSAKTGTSLKERVGALKNLRPFLMMVWRTSRGLTAASMVLRLFRAVLPVVTLYVGKLIIDDVMMLVQMPDKPGTLLEWIDSDLLRWFAVWRPFIFFPTSRNRAARRPLCA